MALVAASADYATKDDLGKLTDKIDGLTIKVEAVQKTVDAEAMRRTDLKLPRRVHDLEEKLYGSGRSRHPVNVPL